MDVWDINEEGEKLEEEADEEVVRGSENVQGWFIKNNIARDII